MLYLGFNRLGFPCFFGFFFFVGDKVRGSTIDKCFIIHIGKDFVFFFFFIIYTLVSTLK